MISNKALQAYRSVAKAWNDFVIASWDADAQGLEQRGYWAYVIELDRADDSNADEPKPWLYVGESARTPEERLAEHLAGIHASRVVQRHGIQLRPELCLDQPVLRTRNESKAYEAWLFAFLSAQGYPCEGGH